MFIIDHMFFHRLRFSQCSALGYIAVSDGLTPQNCHRHIAVTNITRAGHQNLNYFKNSLLKIIAKQLFYFIFLNARKFC